MKVETGAKPAPLRGINVGGTTAAIEVFAVTLAAITGKNPPERTRGTCHD
jgi:hypothetical protein